MDTRDGSIIDSSKIEEEIKKDTKLAKALKPMVVPPTGKQLKRNKIGRNDPCPCGSGKKFKKCCLGSIK